MLRVLALVAASVVCVNVAFAYLGPAPAEPDRLWYTIVAQSPIQSAADFEIRTLFAVPKDWGKSEPPNDVRVEVRDADTLELAASISVEPFYWHEFGLQSQSGSFFERALRHGLSDLPPGEYVLAIVAGGSRMSNVTELVIDSKFDLNDEPLLDLVSIEPPLYRELPYLAVRLNCTAWTEINLSEPTVVADGVYRRRHVSVGGGRSTLSAGTRILQTYDVDGFLVPRIERGKVHEYTVTFGGFEPLTIVAAPDRPLGEAWDAAMQRESDAQ